MASGNCFQMARDGDLEGLKVARQNGCPWNEESIKSHLEESIKSHLEKSHQLHTFYGPRRWLERELSISWSSSVVQWMDEIDEALDVELDGMLISDLSSLIKKYV